MIRRILKGMAPAAVLAFMAAPAAAQSAPPAKMGMCVGCHGENGLGRMPDVPHLAGQPVMYLREQLQNFRSGKRPSAVMGVVSKELSDAEIAELAGFFSSIEIQAKAP